MTWKSYAKLVALPLSMLVAVLAMTFGVVAYRSNVFGSTEVPKTIRATGPPILQLERIGQLAPVRVHSADVLTAEGEALRGSWLIKGDALLVCDLSEAKLTQIDSERRTATLELPSPKVTSARVDFEKSKTWSVEKTTWLPWSGGNQTQFRDAAMFHAQELVAEAAASESNLAIAREQTAVVLHNLYEGVGWNVAIIWASK